MTAAARRLDLSGYGRPPDESDDDVPFAQFDGSVPLLPPWRPPSAEAEFAVRAKRVERRESVRSPRAIVRVDGAGGAALFAELVQRVGQDEGPERVWLRPLLLNGTDGTFVDLRGGNDVLMPAEGIAVCDDETRTRVVMNTAATEGELADRCAQDERWTEAGAAALRLFVLHMFDSSCEGDT